MSEEAIWPRSRPKAQTTIDTLVSQERPEGKGAGQARGPPRAQASGPIDRPPQGICTGVRMRYPALAVRAVRAYGEPTVGGQKAAETHRHGDLGKPQRRKRQEW